MSEPQTWSDVERLVASLPRPRAVHFAARAARRVLPAVADLEAAYGPEAREWATATEAAVRAAEAFARGEPVSSFALRAAAEVVRVAAAATADAARAVGPSGRVEAAELAYAAAAFAADAARVPSDARAATLVMQAARAAAGGGAVPREQLADLEALARGPEPGPLG